MDDKIMTILTYLCALCGEKNQTPQSTRWNTDGTDYADTRGSVRDFLIYSGEMVHRKENQPQSPQRAQSFDAFLCVLCALCGYAMKTRFQIWLHYI
jgi:hypothetical protein